MRLNDLILSSVFLVMCGKKAFIGNNKKNKFSIFVLYVGAFYMRVGMNLDLFLFIHYNLIIMYIIKL